MHCTIDKKSKNFHKLILQRKTLIWLVNKSSDKYSSCSTEYYFCPYCECARPCSLVLVINDGQWQAWGFLLRMFIVLWSCQILSSNYTLFSACLVVFFCLFVCFAFSFSFNWKIVDLQCHDSFKCTLKWFRYICIQILFPYRLLYNMVIKTIARD